MNSCLFYGQWEKQSLLFVFTCENTKQMERMPLQRGQAYMFLVQKVADNTYASRLGWLIFKTTISWRWKGA